MPTLRSARIEAAARGHKYCLVMEPGRDGDKVVTSRKGVGRFVITVKGRACMTLTSRLHKAVQALGPILGPHGRVSK